VGRAAVVLRPGQNASAGQFNAHLLRHGFANWQLPQRYEFIDAVPRTSTGKFWKMKLRERFPK
jgi:fatty-acyl-CoA synthase